MSDASTETVQALPTLYETDFAVWLDQTAQLLREKRFTEIDLDNLIEEIESLSRRDKRELRSRLIVLLSHLLKYHYQSENCKPKLVEHDRRTTPLNRTHPRRQPQLKGLRD